MLVLINSKQSAAQRNVENSELKVVLFEWAFCVCNSLKSGLKDHLGDWRGWKKVDKNGLCHHVLEHTK